MDESGNNSSPEEINILKEEINKKNLIKEQIETLGNLTTKSVKQDPIQSQSFTSESNENSRTLAVLPVSDKESNLYNTKTKNISDMNNKLDGKSTYITSKKTIHYRSSISNY